MNESLEVEETDGRTARRDRNRVAVLDAAIALFADGNLQPKPEDVAARSGVSLRSVYRYYSKPPELLRAAMARHLERVEALLAIEAIGEGDLAGRIERFVSARIRLHNGIGPVARAARMAAAHNDVIRGQYEATRRTLREQVECHFAPELTPLDRDDRRAIASALDALVQLDALDYFRLDRGFSAKQTAAVLRRAITKLLSA